MVSLHPLFSCFRGYADKPHHKQEDIILNPQPHCNRKPVCIKPREDKVASRVGSIQRTPISLDLPSRAGSISQQLQPQPKGAQWAPGSLDVPSDASSISQLMQLQPDPLQLTHPQLRHAPELSPSETQDLYPEEQSLEDKQPSLVGSPTQTFTAIQSANVAMDSCHQLARTPAAATYQVFHPVLGTRKLVSIAVAHQAARLHHASFLGVEDSSNDSPIKWNIMSGAPPAFRAPSARSRGAVLSRAKTSGCESPGNTAKQLMMRRYRSIAPGSLSAPSNIQAEEGRRCTTTAAVQSASDLATCWTWQMSQNRELKNALDPALVSRWSKLLEGSSSRG